MGRFFAAVAIVALASTLSGVQLAAQAIDGIWEAKFGANVLTLDFDSHLASFNGAPPVPVTPVTGSDPLSVEFDLAAGGRPRRFSGKRTGATIEGALAGQTLVLVRLPDSTPRLVGRSRYPLPTPGRDGQAIAKARSMVQELVRTLEIPGLSVAVARDGAVVWSEGFGLADVEQGVPVTTLTRFRLGSVSKVLTAAGVARLVEDGKLDLDAPIQRYVPDFPAKPWPITTRQLTSHTSGIRHYGPRDFDGALKGTPHFASVRLGLSLFEMDPLLFQPGTAYEYSSYGWNVVSAVIEGASKEEFLSFMQRAVFNPLALRGVSPDHVDAIVPNRTRFYAREAPGRPLENAPYVDNSYKWAGGGFLATAEDLVRFGAAHLLPGFFRQSTLDLLHRPQSWIPPDRKVGVGIGWRSSLGADGRRILHHGGTIEGGRAMLLMFPDSKVVVAMLANILVGFGENDAQRLGVLFITPS
jgi:serine beta-lactamase-like protein LACTB, mitochondrial